MKIPVFESTVNIGVEGQYTESIFMQQSLGDIENGTSGSGRCLLACMSCRQCSS